MKIIELIIDENDEYSGIDAISLVEFPAIEENWVALNENKREYKFKALDEDKKILIGALLVPNKMIYRKDGDEEYYIHFTKDTVKKASELYLINGNHLPIRGGDRIRRSFRRSGWHAEVPQGLVKHLWKTSNCQRKLGTRCIISAAHSPDCCLCGQTG